MKLVDHDSSLESVTTWGVGLVHIPGVKRVLTVEHGWQINEGLWRH